MGNWIVDVKKTEIIAFEMMSNGGSRRIRESMRLPGLAIGLLEMGLERDRTSDNTTVGTWFLAQLQNSSATNPSGE